MSRMPPQPRDRDGYPQRGPQGINRPNSMHGSGHSGNSNYSNNSGNSGYGGYSGNPNYSGKPNYSGNANYSGNSGNSNYSGNSLYGPSGNSGNGPNQRRPKQRPAGYSGYSYNRSGASARSNNRPAPRPPAPRHPAGPASFEPVIPASGKQRRRMAKAAAWRLARLLCVRPAEILSSNDLFGLLDRAMPSLRRDGQGGDAARLVAKIQRLAKE